MTPGRAACPPPHPVNLEVVPRTSEGRGWRPVFKHLEPSTRSRSTLGQGFGAQPFHPQSWKARRAVQIPEGGGWAQAQILPVACFSVGTLGRAVGSALARTAWSSPRPLPAAHPYRWYLPACPHRAAHCLVTLPAALSVHTSGLRSRRGPAGQALPSLSICPSSELIPPPTLSQLLPFTSAGVVGPDLLSPTEVGTPQGRRLHLRSGSQGHSTKGC